MPKEEQILAASILDGRRDAQRYESELSYIMEGLKLVSHADGPNEELEEKELVLASYIQQMLTDSAALAEWLNLPILAQRIWSEIDELKENGVDMSVTPFDVHLVSEALLRTQELARPLLSMVNETAITGLSVFEAILRNTPAIIHDRELAPHSEADVQRAVFDVLRYALPDMQREVSVGQVSKAYKLDFGSKAIAAAAEYKYVENQNELKKAIGGIYEDMKGYSGHYEWRNFYAVFYLTSPIANVAQIEAEFQHVGVGTNWRPIVVHGTGDRKRNTKE
jgi:hypothetical protein